MHDEGRVLMDENAKEALMMRRWIGSMLAMLLIGGLAGSAVAQAPTADEILDRMDVESDRLAAGGMISIIRFDNEYGDGTTSSNLFGSLSKPGKSLLYFIEPEDVRGTVFLSVDAEEEDGSARLWLFLPLLGIPKELVSEEERGGSFAGSSISYEQIGGDDVRTDYESVLSGQETLTIGDRTRAAYRLDLTAKKGADVDAIRVVFWVDSEFFTMLKMENYNDLGRLDSTMLVARLDEFEGRLVAGIMIAEDIGDKGRTTVTFEDRRRPDGEIPDDVFSPGSLASFDPAGWGFSL